MILRLFRCSSIWTCRGRTSSSSCCETSIGSLGSITDVGVFVVIGAWFWDEGNPRRGGEIQWWHRIGGDWLAQRKMVQCSSSPLFTSDSLVEDLERRCRQLLFDSLRVLNKLRHLLGESEILVKSKLAAGHPRRECCCFDVFENQCCLLSLLLLMFHWCIDWKSDLVHFDLMIIGNVAIIWNFQPFLARSSWYRTFVLVPVSGMRCSTSRLIVRLLVVHCSTTLNHRSAMCHPPDSTLHIHPPFLRTTLTVVEQKNNVNLAVHYSPLNSSFLDHVDDDHPCERTNSHHLFWFSHSSTITGKFRVRRILDYRHDHWISQRRKKP